MSKKSILGPLAALSKKQPQRGQFDHLTIPIPSKDEEIPLQPSDFSGKPRDLEAEAYALLRDTRFFELQALAVYDRGWMPIPQTRRGGRRPGQVDGRAIAWGQYTKQRPDRSLMQHWGRDPVAGACNLAIILGEASDNTIGIDLDIYSKEENAIARDCASEFLGETMVRIGNAPKSMSFYRFDDPTHIPHYGKFVLADAAGGPSDQMIEILGNCRMVTAMGLHHTTGNMFQYVGGQPGLHSPRERATTITTQQFDAFCQALSERLKLYLPPRAMEEYSLEGVTADNIRVPHITAWSGNEWIEKDEKVFDGREAFLWSTVKGFVKMNPAASIEQLVPLVIEAFRAGEHPDKRWMLGRLQEEAKDKVWRAQRLIQEGKMSPSSSRRKPRDIVIDGVVTKTETIEPIAYASPKPRNVDGPTSFLNRRKRDGIRVKFTGADPVKAKERALRLDRDVVGAEAAKQTISGLDKYFDDVIAGTDMLHVLDGPTGVGKSTMFLKRAGQRRDEIMAKSADDDTRTGLFMFVPSYNNVDDLRSKAAMLGLDGNATDEELIAAATAENIVAPGDLDDHLKQLRRFAVSSNLSHMTLKGKVAAGCKRGEEVRLLQKSGVPTSALCKTKVRPRDAMGNVIEGEEPVTKYCPFYHECPAIAQRAKLKEVDLVFMVRNFLTLPMPEEAENPRGIIIDERMFDLLVHEKTFPLSTLKIARRDPKLTKKEREIGLTPRDLIQDHDEAADHATDVLRRRGDLADYFHALKIKRDNGKVVTGFDLVFAARRVCGSAMNSQADLTPDLSLEEIRAMCATPTGTNIGAEFRFWKILEEQITDLRLATLDSTKAPAPDRRIRIVGEITSKNEDGSTTDLDPDIQIAWRSDPNWSHVPTLLLDASTDPVLTSLALGGREVVTHPVEVSLNQCTILAVDRRLSMRSMFPGKDAPAEKKLEAAQTLADMRLLVASTAGAHSHGRVLFDAPMKLRRALLKDWTPPENADFCHYGATAGLDFARRHVCIVFLSRMELPTKTIDGLVSALSHGQPNPEPLIDPLGTGEDEYGTAIEYNVIRHDHPMRDGGTATWDLDEHVGDLAKRVQKQYREEEHRQGAGRGRMVYRDDTVTVIGVTQTPPRDMVADEVVGFKDLTDAGNFWDAVRLSGGVVEASILAEHAPHLADVEGFENQINFYFKKNDLVRSRFHQITAVFEDGSEKTIYVAGHYDQWRGKVRALLRTMGWSGVLRRAVDCAVQTPAAEAAPLDKLTRVQTAMGCKELELLADLQEKLMTRGEWCPTRGMMGSKGPPGIYRAGDEGYADKRLTLGTWLAFAVIDDEWVRDGMLTREQQRFYGLGDETVKVRAA